MNIDIEEKIYKQIALEIQSNNISDGLWVKATQLTATDNKNIIRAKYIDLRKDQIHREMIFRSEQAKIREEQEKITKDKKLQQIEAAKAEKESAQRKKEFENLPLSKKIFRYTVFALVLISLGVAFVAIAFSADINSGFVFLLIGTLILFRFIRYFGFNL